MGDFQPKGPTIDVLGVNAAWAKRARKWLADRSLLSFYDPKQKALRAFEFKHGPEWTEKQLRDALEATR